MNFASIAVVAIVVGFAALAVWRNLKKGAPCECGGACKSCRGCSCCDSQVEK
ncbi:MAG: FeoB-associated Cys-rich membrane protein [Kiritimatiellae bacterium]|nr:FeoB-associated Cys-rich membrane protein [Kiritimatiellia bacterium]